MTSELKEALDNITGTFAGDYGIAKNMHFKQNLTQLEQRACMKTEDLVKDEAARELISLVVKFSRLIDILVPVQYRGPEK